MLRRTVCVFCLDPDKADPDLDWFAVEGSILTEADFDALLAGGG